jgi:hypothetical protein
VHWHFPSGRQELVCFLSFLDGFEKDLVYGEVGKLVVELGGKTSAIWKMQPGTPKRHTCLVSPWHLIGFFQTMRIPCVELVCEYLKAAVVI